MSYKLSIEIIFLWKLFYNKFIINLSIYKFYKNTKMTSIQDYFEFGEGLDFFTKYGLLISNLLVILVIIIAKKFRSNKIYS